MNYDDYESRMLGTHLDGVLHCPRIHDQTVHPSIT